MKQLDERGKLSRLGDIFGLVAVSHPKSDGKCLGWKFEQMRCSPVNLVLVCLEGITNIPWWILAGWHEVLESAVEINPWWMDLFLLRGGLVFVHICAISSGDNPFPLRKICRDRSYNMTTYTIQDRGKSTKCHYVKGFAVWPLTFLIKIGPCPWQQRQAFLH